MCNLVKPLIIGALLAAMAPFASATPLSGTITIAPTFTPGSKKVASSTTNDTQSTTGIHFYVVSKGFVTGKVPSGTVNGGTGDFSSLAADIVSLGIAPFYTISANMNNAFHFTDGSLGYIQFDSTAYHFNVAPGTSMFDGFLHAGGSIEAATYTVTNLNGSYKGSFTSEAMTPTPEPSSLILLGTGLIGAAGMMLRKRRLA